MALVLQTIICSTRPGRIGPAIGDWFHGIAAAHSGFEATRVDLADFDLPVYNEPLHPRMQAYEHAHTKRWSQSVAAADAYVFVTPEYNFNPPPALLNALNYVYSEWNYKPCAFVSYGGISGGLRSVQATKLVATTLKMMPILEAVCLPMVAKQLDDAGRFVEAEGNSAAATAVLDELQRWASALQAMREPIAA